MNRILSVLVASLLVFTVTDISSARRIDRPAVETPGVEQHFSNNRRTPALAPRPRVEAGVVQSWTFDSGGAAALQGWTTFDRIGQPALFHVDYVGAIDGFKSLWIGANTACMIPWTCGYATLPGYGNNWRQLFVSEFFPTTGGDITAHFDITYDCEPNYDQVFFEYMNYGGTWQTARVFEGIGSETVNEVIPGQAGAIAFRFRFYSDSEWSDEDGLRNSNDGAAHIDDIVITEQGKPTPLDSQDFETEPIGWTETNDHEWNARGWQYGGYAALFSGTAVLQEDPQAVNTSHFWGFYSGSPDNYACGGHPEQTVVPFKQLVWDNQYAYINDEIRSPTVSLAGISPSEPVLLTFDVYRDQPVDNLVFYDWRVRSRMGGVWQNWRESPNVYYGTGKTWKVVTFDLRPKIDSGATEIQVAIGVLDKCEEWCGDVGSGACHSHGPLIDNVQVTTSNTAAGTNVQTSPTDPTTGINPAFITFSEVVTPGLTTVTSMPTNPGMPYGSNVYYEIATTAEYTGTINLNIKYVESDLVVPEASLKLLHWDTRLTPDQWVDVTTSINTSTNRIMGTTTSLSPFVLAEAIPTAATPSPSAIGLHQNVPNPFNPMTTITYDVPDGGADVSIRIYDAAGRLVRSLVDEHRPAGTQSISWDGRDGMGTAVSSGVYFYRMVSGSFTDSKRMVLLK